MANSKSAKKRIRQSRRRQEQNRKQRSRLRTAIKNVSNAEDADTATAACRRNLLHPNKAARKKSQLAKIVKEKGGTV